MKTIKPIWIIVVLSAFSSIFFNQLNLKHLPEELIRKNETVITSDDLSYLKPPIHYYNNGIWKDSVKGKISYFARPPGYGAVYYLALLINPNNPLLVIKIIQVAVFVASVYLLYLIALSFKLPDNIALTTVALYGILPIASNFLFYTLTEGITPSLLIIYLFLLMKIQQQTDVKKKKIYLLLSSLVFAILFVIRPVIGIFIGLLPIFVFANFKLIKQRLTYSIITLCFGYSLMGLWQYRNYKITNQYVGLHPIYFVDNNSMYRPTLQAFWNFTLGWAEDVPKIHSYMIPFWQQTIAGDTGKTYINNIIENFPSYVTQHFGYNRLESMLINYQKSILEQKKYYEQELPMPLTKIESEEETIKDINALTSEFKKDFWFEYHISSPIKVYKNMGFHSNLSLFIFQKTYRGQIWMESLRWISFLIHSACFVSIFLILFGFNKMKITQYSIFLFCFIYLFYLSYFQRGIEERYTLPILSILLISLAFLMNSFVIFYRQKFSRKKIDEL